MPLIVCPASRTTTRSVMNTTARIATLGASASLGVAAIAAAFAGPAAATPAPQQTHSPVHPPAHRLARHHSTSVFVQTDNLNGNSIVAYARAADGTLSQAGVY